MSDSEGNQYSRHVKVYQYARHLKATDMTDMRNALLMKYIKNKHVFDTVGNNVLRTQRYIRTTCFGGIQPKSIQYRSLTLLFLYLHMLWTISGSERSRSEVKEMLSTVRLLRERDYYYVEMSFEHSFLSLFGEPSLRLG